MGVSDSDNIWNRAAFEGGGPTPLEGDVALAALLAVHGMVMNGGTDHAIEVLDAFEFAAGVAGFRYFGLLEAASMLEAAQMPQADHLDLNARYGALIPNDSTLVEAFKAKLLVSPAVFAPLSEGMPNKTMEPTR